jgi:hypothetical protein
MGSSHENLKLTHNGEVASVPACLVREFYLRNDWADFELISHKARTLKCLHEELNSGRDKSPTTCLV